MSEAENRAIRMQELLLRKTKPVLSAQQMAIEMLAEKDRATLSMEKGFAFNSNISKILEASSFKDSVISKMEGKLSHTELALINSMLKTRTFSMSTSRRPMGWAKWQDNPFNKTFGIGNSSSHFHFNNGTTYYFTKIASAYQAAKLAESLDLLEKETEQEETETKESSLIIKETTRIVSLIEDIHNNNKLMYEIHPRDFEKLMTELLREKGFDVHLTQETRDGGYDIIALQSLGGFANKYLVECKRWGPDNPVGIAVVKSFITTMKDNDANKGIMFTTSYFPKDVYTYQQDKLPNRLDLKDGVDVVNWISDYVIK